MTRGRRRLRAGVPGVRGRKPRRVEDEPAVRELATLPHCCEMMRYYIDHEDRVIYYWARFDEYLVPVHDGGAASRCSSAPGAGLVCRSPSATSCWRARHEARGR